MEGSQIIPFNFVIEYNNQKNTLQCAQNVRQQQTLKNCVYEYNAKRPFRHAIIGAIENPSIQYFHSYEKIRQEIFARLVKRIVTEHCFVLQPCQENKNCFVCTFFKPCVTCHAMSICEHSLSLLLLLLDVQRDVDSVSTSIEKFQHRFLKSQVFSFPIGLYCLHDWTNGTGDIVFEKKIDVVPITTPKQHIVVLPLAKRLTPETISFQQQQSSDLRILFVPI